MRGPSVTYGPALDRTDNMRYRVTFAFLFLRRPEFSTLLSYGLARHIKTRSVKKYRYEYYNSPRFSPDLQPESRKLRSLSLRIYGVSDHGSTKSAAHLSEWSRPSLLEAYTIVLSAWVKWTRSAPYFWDRIRCFSIACSMETNMMVSMADPDDPFFVGILIQTLIKIVYLY